MTDAKRAALADLDAGDLSRHTLGGYRDRLGVYALSEFGSHAAASIAPTHCERFLSDLVAAGLTPATSKHQWSVFRRVLDYAVQHKASRQSGQRRHVLGNANHEETKSTAFSG